MGPAGVLRELAARIPPLWHEVLEGLDAAALAQRPGPEANPIGWLAWHATRIADDHVAHLAGSDQVWPDHAPAFDLQLDLADHGYDHTTDQVDHVARAVAAAGVEALLAYVDAVAVLVEGYVDSVDAAELDRVVDDAWDPPVTAGVRFVSLVSDNLQHAGQAAYIRGLLDRT